MNHDYIDTEAPLVTASGTEIQTNERLINNDQITWQASPRNKLQFAFRSDNNDNGNVFVSALRPADSAANTTRDLTEYRVNWTAPYSTRILVETVAAVTEIDATIGPTVDVNTAVNDCVPNDPILANAFCFDNESQLQSGPFQLSRDDSSQRFTLRSEATIYGGEFWGGTHEFKLGVNVENERFFRQDVVQPSAVLRYHHLR